MSGTTPEMYYWCFVVPNFEDLCTRPNDVRLAFNSAISAFHMSDVILEYQAKLENRRVLREERASYLENLSRDEPLFITVQTAATVYKHFHSTQSFLDTNSPQGFRGVVSPSPKLTISAKHWRDSGEQHVSVFRQGGGKVSLNVALERVVRQMWPELLAIST